MNYPRIAQKFYGQEWYVREDWHRNAGQILRPHLMGEAVPPMMSVPAERMDSRPGFANPRTDRDGNIFGVQESQGFALLRIDGTIGRHLDFFEVACAGGYDLCQLENQVQALSDRSEIHTVIFSFNTPGGVAAGNQECAELIAELGEEKRTVGWVDNEACSAGYYLASACGEIYAQPSAYVGSISTILAILDTSRAFEMEGLKMEIFTDGKLKSMGYPGTELSEEQRAFLEARKTEVGTAFKTFVSSRRPQIPAEAMEGGFYSGQTALDLGLVDGFYNTLADLTTALIDSREAA